MRRLLAICLVGFGLAPLLAGCGTFESGSTWNIKLRSDTGRVVVVKECKTSACGVFRYVEQLSTGATARALDYGDGTSWWLVTARSGRNLGCLTLGISKRVDGYTLSVSSLVKCP
jgi:hypothetical protein